MKPVPSVCELRKKGWKVRVGHFRRYYKYLPHNGKRVDHTLLKKDFKNTFTDFFLDAKGGYTTVTLKSPDYDQDFFGISECSTKEHYRRDTGIKKALARALASWSQDHRNSGN
jgi:hypothetical protein